MFAEKGLMSEYSVLWREKFVPVA